MSDSRLDEIEERNNHGHRISIDDIAWLIDQLRAAWEDADRLAAYFYDEVPEFHDAAVAARGEQ